MIGTETVLQFKTVGACTWLPPANISTFQVLVVGGGGGASSVGGGGGRVLSQDNVPLSNTVTISVGAGGIGGVGSYSDPQNYGKTGASSSITNGSVSVVSLGPKNPNDSPFATSKSIPSTAKKSP
jgi:hypothetical protein